MPTTVRPLPLLAHALATMVLAVGGLAHAASVPLTANGPWAEFDIDDFAAQSGGTEWIDFTDGSALTFTFTVSGPTQLRVVDAGFAGDTFSVTLNGAALGTTSAVAPVAYSDSLPSVGTDFDAAWADASYSRGSWLLGAGTYSLTGALLQSVSLDGAPLNATVGAVMIAAVPEPTSWALLLAGLSVVGVVLRRRA
jgi:PEP-CTERM motif